MSDEEIQTWKKLLAEVEDAPALPNDRQVLEEVGIANFYERVYRMGSDFIHAGIDIPLKSTAAERVDEMSLRGDHELAEEALHMAFSVYGLFLSFASKTVVGGISTAT